MEQTLLKACFAAVLCAVSIFVIKPLKGDFAPLIRVAGSVLILLFLLPQIEEVWSEAASLLTGSGMDRYASVMLRSLGLAFLTRICSDVCRDMGENGVAGGVEMAGKIAILVLCLPMIEEILGYAAQILERASE